MTFTPRLDAEPRRIIHGANRNWLVTLWNLVLRFYHLDEVPGKNTGSSLGRIEVSCRIPIAVDRRRPCGCVRVRQLVLGAAPRPSRGRRSSIQSRSVLAEAPPERLANRGGLRYRRRLA